MKQNGNYRIQKLKFVVLTMFVCVLLLSQNFTVLTQAATARATTMKLDSFKGSVTVKTMNGSQRKASKGMRLLNGYEVSTADGSEAFISLDNSKAVKLDAKSSVQVRQAGNRLELMIKSGKVFFNVSKPLKSNETLNVRSSTMVAGVRGTSGYATVHEEETKMYLLEGNLGMTRTNPVTNKVETVQIKGGEVASSYKYEQKKVDVTIEKFTEVDVPAFVVEEVAKDVELQKKIDTEELSALSSEKLLEVKKYYDQGLTQEEIIEKVEEEAKQEEKKEAVTIPSTGEASNSNSSSSAGSSTIYAIQFVDASGQVISGVNQVGFEASADGMKSGASIPYQVFINGEQVMDSVSAANEKLYRPRYSVTALDETAGDASFDAHMGWGIPYFSCDAPGSYELKVELLHPNDETKVLASKTLTYTIRGLENPETDYFVYTEGANGITLKSLTSLGKTVTDLTIPASIREKKVIAISANGELLANNTNLKTVKIDAKLKNIPSHTFRGCTNLTTVELPEGLTTLESFAFDSCSSLTSISIPDSVTSIGDYVFWDCKSLASVTLPSHLERIPAQAFYGCEKLSGITLPNTLKAIGNSAFDGCKGLKSITLPNSLTSIARVAFDNCTGLTSITVPNSVTSIGESVFASCSGLSSVTLSNQITTIPQYAFLSCTNLTDISLPDSVTTIESYAFMGCSTLTSISLPNGIQSIDRDAFSGCSDSLAYLYKGNQYSSYDALMNAINNPSTVVDPGEIFEYVQSGSGIAITGLTDAGKNLTNITIPKSINGIRVTELTGGSSSTGLFASNQKINSVTIEADIQTLPDWTFYDCSVLSSVVLPDGITSIGTSAFSVCQNLQSVNLPNSITQIGDYAFYSCFRLDNIVLPNQLQTLENSTFELCSGLSEIVLPTTLKTIDYRAFYDCSALANIALPNGLEELSEESFYGCSKLASIQIPDKITKIERNTFGGCIGLSSITWPDQLSVIGDYSFFGCKNLTTISLPDTVTEIDEYAFYNCSKLSSVILSKEIKILNEHAFEECPDTLIFTYGVNTYQYSTQFEELRNEIDNNQLFIYAENESGDGVIITDLAEWAEQKEKIVIPEKTIDGKAIKDIGSKTDSETGEKISIFADFWQLKEITINAFITTIPANTFSGCWQLAIVTLPDSITTIGDNAFDESVEGFKLIYKGVEYDTIEKVREAITTSDEL